jgi:DNA polymerase-3 subunit alpha
MADMTWVSLHHHTTMSNGDGFDKVEKHVEVAASYGMSAMAVTEHGNVSSHVQLEKAADKHGIRPIFGLEAYTASANTRQKFHQTVLAETLDGYHNLNKLVGRSYAEGFYQWPTIHPDWWGEHANGLIVTSGCSDSWLGCILLGGKSLGDKRDRASAEDIRTAERLIRQFQEWFGKDNYYLETQRFPDLPRCCTHNEIYAELSRRTDAPLVATADVHYPYPEDNAMQRILHAAHRGGTVETADASWEYDIHLSIPKSDREIGRQLMRTGLSRRDAWEAICNSAEIAARCDFRLPKNERLRFPLPRGATDKLDLIWQWLRDGWEFRYPHSAHMQAHEADYAARVKHEMELVVGRDYVDYFLMLSDAVRFAKDTGIPVGPARGSAAASLVCYLLRITEVNPMEFPNMVLERFLDPSRTDLPDVDLDFSDDRRDEVREHMVRRYGADRVGNIGNFVRYQGKSALNDVARVYQLPFGDVETIKSLVIERSGGDSRFDSTLEDTIEMFPAARESYERHPELQYALRLEGNYRSMNVHAAGLVVSNDPIENTCALITRTVNGVSKTVLPYDKKDIEYLGMLKADFLSLSTLGAIGHTLELLDMPIEELYRVPLDEPRTLQAFRDSDVIGIFQFEGRATRSICARVQPDTFMHLAHINALSRPGPLFSGMAEAYIGVRSGDRKREKLHPVVDKLTESTYGQIIFQEQVLTIIRELGGFPVTRVHEIRRIISQKLGEIYMQNMREQFIEGAGKLHDMDPDLALRIWNFMVTSASYSFNQAHAVSYSMLSFWQMWLKVHHPSEFFAGAMRKVKDDKHSIEWRRPRMLRDAKRHGLAILAPGLFDSAETWIPGPPNKFGPNGSLVAGFRQVPGIGPTQASRIATAVREQPGEFQTWGDLAKIPGIGPKKIEQIQQFAYKNDPFDLDLTGKILNELRGELRRGIGPLRNVPQPTHTSDQIADEQERAWVTWVGVVRHRQYKDYLEDQRSKTGKDVEEILAEMDRPDLLKSCQLQCYDDGEEEVYVRFSRWNFPKFKDRLDRIVPGQDIVVVSGRTGGRQMVGNAIQGKALYVITMEENNGAEE